MKSRFSRPCATLTIALVGFGLVLATPPLRGQERSYSATREVVWNAVHEALSGLQIAVTKELRKTCLR